MTSWFPIVVTLCGATAGGIDFLLSDRYFSILNVVQFCCFFLGSGIMYGLFVTVHTQRKSFLLASWMSYMTVPSTILDLLQFLVYNKPLDIRGMRGTLFPIFGTFLGIGFSSFFHDRIFKPFISFDKPSSGESPEIKPDHEKRRSTPELSELV